MPPSLVDDLRMTAHDIYGFKATRGTLKYRCPASTYGFTCKGLLTSAPVTAGCVNGTDNDINLTFEHDL